MKWINAGERMPVDGASVIFRRVGDKYNNSLILGGALSMKIFAVEEINKEKLANGHEPFKIDMNLFEWLDESPDGEEDVVWVIYDTLRNQFLDKGDFFRKELKFANTYSSEAEAEKAKNYYIKIYKETNRKETTEFLETIPVGLQKFLKRKL
jgi:hypothetical protein